MPCNRFFFAFVILSTLYAALVSAGEPASTKSHACIKCETPYILELYLTGAGKIAQRPQLVESVVSEQYPLRVHFDTSGEDAPDQTDTDQNGIPDYVDSTLVYLEYAWTTIWT